MNKPIFVPVMLLAGLAPAATPPADSQRGEALFRSLTCIQCHTTDAKGGPNLSNLNAPDLTRIVDRAFSPSGLAATMWNHAPAMWASMRARELRAADLNPQAAADLFAYFYSTRFFEKPSDAGRGKNLFSSKRCVTCHAVADLKIASREPIALIDAMWNHVSNMRQEFTRRKLPWPELTAQDLSDMLLYLRNQPGAPHTPTRLEITSGAAGEALFKSKGCANCHGEKRTPLRLKGQTLTEIAVDMWNHAPKMPPSPAQISPEEMRDLISYIWAEQFFEDSGSASAGRRVFVNKCAQCHNDSSSGAPRLPRPGSSFNGASLVSALWHHGPAMLDQMKSRNIPWPRFEAVEMADLIAYLNK